MTTMSERLIETIDKDIQELEQAQSIENKVLRKECSLLKQRILSLKKIVTDSSQLTKFEQRLELLTKRS